MIQKFIHVLTMIYFCFVFATANAKADHETTKQHKKKIFQRVIQTIFLQKKTFLLQNFLISIEKANIKSAVI